MEKYYIYFLGILFYTFSQQVAGQCYLNLNLKGKKYDTLYLIIRTDRSHKIKGESDDKQNWLFLYPDTVYDQHKYMEIEFLENDTLVHLLSFRIPFNQDTLKIGSFSVGKHSHINACYIETEKQSKVPFMHFKDYINDAFLVAPDNDLELLTTAEAMHKGYSMFDRSRDSLTYNERLKNYIYFTAKNPSSHYLISSLHSTLSFYKDTEDIKKIFFLFSDNNKNSHYGKKIQDFLDMTFFENSILPAWDNSDLEPIIVDSTKFNLIVFSASWCGPCHKQIPKLKKVNNELQDRLNIVYVSIDESKTVEEWKQLMIKEKIPWRSLLGADNIKVLKNKYFIQSIPLAFLVFPNGQMERLKLYEESDIKRIYSAVNTN